MKFLSHFECITLILSLNELKFSIFSLIPVAQQRQMCQERAKDNVLHTNIAKAEMSTNPLDQTKSVIKLFGMRIKPTLATQKSHNNNKNCTEIPVNTLSKRNC